MLKKIRRFTQLLQREAHEVSFKELCESLRDGLPETSVYLINRRGKIHGFAIEDGLDSTAFDQEWLSTGFVDQDLNDSLLKIGAIADNPVDSGMILVTPVVGSSRRVGSLVFYRSVDGFSDEDTVIAEFASTAIGLIIAHALDEEVEDEAQETKLARSAIKSLSYSEILAMQHIFDELDGDEGLLVASRIADNAGITRSVIVNALRKLASANVVESRSLGMKGTYLRVLNREIRNEFEAQRYPYPKNNGAADEETVVEAQEEV